MDDTFRSIPPTPALRPFVKNLWLARDRIGEADHTPDQLLPNSSVDLVVNLGHPHWFVQGSGRVRRALGWVTGLRTEPMAFGPTDGVHVVGVSFQPWGARAFLDLPLQGVMALLRFRRSVELIGRRDGCSWTGIALDCGNYDHSHFIREFRRLAGMTPTAYGDRQLPIPGFARRDL